MSREINRPAQVVVPRPEPGTAPGWCPFCRARVDLEVIDVQPLGLMVVASLRCVPFGHRFKAPRVGDQRPKGAA